MNCFHALKILTDESIIIEEQCNVASNFRVINMLIYCSCDILHAYKHAYIRLQENMGYVTHKE